ncbi:hypothetical protein [Enterovibrio coralii]|uniref:Uncharacterized protein n=1 Tax=Enterovibrio coralii TaxID=294935 RepID=A0A135IDT6_9GAMM|nr:hypothetical protein [Enterovibrio coralii]KXF83578.1 hypothetical protein ATN88_24430 [Enterovibrio coralii]
MKYVYMFIGTLVLSSPSAVNGSTAEFFSRLNFVGLKLALADGVSNGVAPAMFVSCMNNVQDDFLVETYSSILTENYSHQQVTSTDEFLSTKLGVKYANTLVKLSYKSLGKKAPENLLVLTSDEVETLEEIWSKDVDAILGPDSKIYSPALRLLVGNQIDSILHHCYREERPNKPLQ